jgi:hypothetical protein
LFRESYYNGSNLSTKEPRAGANFNGLRTWRKTHVPSSVRWQAPHSWCCRRISSVKAAVGMTLPPWAWETRVPLDRKQRRTTRQLPPIGVGGGDTVVCCGGTRFEAGAGGPVKTQADVCVCVLAHKNNEALNAGFLVYPLYLPPAYPPQQSSAMICSTRWW